LEEESAIPFHIKDAMDRPNFRVFGLDTSYDNETEECFVTSGSTTEPTKTAVVGKAIELGAPRKVSVRLVDLLPILMEASKANRRWLRDFDEDSVEVPQDLYEVALAYQSMRRAA
jgi:hypothetical protein